MLPTVIVSGNGRSFASEQFGEFIRKNVIRHKFFGSISPGNNWKSRMNGINHKNVHKNMGRTRTTTEYVDEIKVLRQEMPPRNYLWDGNYEVV